MANLIYSTVQYSTVQHSTAQYSTVQHSTVQYSTVQYSTCICNATDLKYIDEVTKSVNEKRLMTQNINELRAAAIVFVNSRAKHLLAAKSLRIQRGSFNFSFNFTQ